MARSITVLGGKRIRRKGNVGPALFFGGTKGKEPGMWWRFWTLYCGPDASGKYRVVVARCPIHLRVSSRFDGHSAGRRARYWMRRAVYYTAAPTNEVARWKRSHQDEWKRIKYSRLGPIATHYALSSRNR